MSFIVSGYDIKGLLIPFLHLPGFMKKKIVELLSNHLFNYWQVCAECYL